MEKIDISDDVKIIVRITNKMIRDYEECERKLEITEETADCSKCSLDASIGGISLCQIDEITGVIKKKMSRLTHERVGDCKMNGYWSPNKKQELVDRLAEYEDTGLDPEQIQELQERDLAKRTDLEGDELI